MTKTQDPVDPSTFEVYVKVYGSIFCGLSNVFFQ